MISFVYSISVLITKLIEIIVKSKVLSECQASFKLKKIDLISTKKLINGKENFRFTKTDNVVAQRLIKDYMSSNKVSPDTFEINKDLVVSLKNSKGTY